MKNRKLLFMSAILMFAFLALGCDESNNVLEMDADPPLLGEGDSAACPCFTESEVKAAAEKVSSEFRVCGFDIAEIGVSEGGDAFTASCNNCQFGMDSCFCMTNQGTTNELTQEEFMACAQALVNTMLDITHTCLPSGS